MNTKNSVIRELDPLKLNYIPDKFINRNKEINKLQSFISDTSRRTGTTLLITGEPGTGKTHVTLKKLHEHLDSTDFCYIPCKRCDSQYKVLRQIFSKVFNKQINRGFHTATLQRELEQQGSLNLVLVLDNIEFLLQNDGDSLLYFLSRINNPGLSMVCITSNTEIVESELGERTYSSLNPRKIVFKSYSSQDISKILVHRAKLSLHPNTLHQKAMKKIINNVTDIRIGLKWLETAAVNAEQLIGEGIVSETREHAKQEFIQNILNDFTFHHELLYLSIKELSKGSEKTLQTGEVYKKYRETCTLYEEDALSNRRISDYIKHLELLNLIQAEYHYGGSKGKTRDITPNEL